MYHTCTQNAQKRRRGKKKEKRRKERRCGARVRNDRSKHGREKKSGIDRYIYNIYIYLYSSLISANLETGGEKEAFREYLARVLRFTLYLLKRNNEKKEEREEDREYLSWISRVDRDRWGERNVYVWSIQGPLCSYGTNIHNEHAVTKPPPLGERNY